MVVNDPIADMLTRIRNAQVAKHDSVTMPASNMKKAIAQILVDEGYIRSMSVTDDDKQGVIHMTLKYNEDKTPVISGIRRVSKPGLRIYTSCDKIPKVINGLGISIISTNQGVMTGKQAKAQSLGGEVLAFVW